MRVFSLTKLGKKVTASHTGDGDEEMKALQYIRENKPVTDAELDSMGYKYIVLRLKDRGLVKELTS